MTDPVRRPPGATGGWRTHVADTSVDPAPAWTDRLGGNNPDPRRPDDDVWDPTIAAWVPRPSAIGSLVAGIVAGAIGGVILGLIIGLLINGSAPRPAATVIPAVAPWSGTQGSSTSGNLSQPTGAPRPSSPAAGGYEPGTRDVRAIGTVSQPLDLSASARAARSSTSEPASLSAVTYSGFASWMPERYGRDYLAMREKRGTVVTICGPGGCWRHAIVNDYGPSSKFRPVRVADIAVGRWETLCGVPRRFGLCEVSVTIERRPGAPLPTAPATDR